MYICTHTYVSSCVYPPTPLPARGRRWGSVRLALERDCGSLLPSLSPSPVQPCTLPAFFHFVPVLLRVFSFLFLSAAGALLWLVLAVDKRVRPGKAREAKLLWLAAPYGPIALLHIGLKTRRSAPGRGGAGCRRTPLVRARCGEASAASKRTKREAVLAGRALGTDSFLLSI